MNILEILKAKSERRKLSMVTSYDAWSARLLAKSPIDMILVGDSAAMVIHGETDTLPATTEMMAMHVRSVRRESGSKFVIADLPFLSYRAGIEAAVRAVSALMQAGAHAVKLEGARGNEALIRHLVESGVPVMGHLGLTPQSIHALGGFRVQGREKEQQMALLADAKALENAGCFAVVLECVPSALAGEVTASLRIPTIGIGAGPHCDGQVLVFHDLMGLNTQFKPRFVRSYLEGAALMDAALEKFHQDVAAGRFPSEQESYE